ncbi:MAG: ABC transporter permease [Chitinophagales bacterium]
MRGQIRVYLFIQKEDKVQEKGTYTFTFRKYAWRQFRKNKPAFISLIMLGMFILVALLAPILANDKPLYAVYQGEKIWPAFSFKKQYHFTAEDGSNIVLDLHNADWKHMPLEKVVWAPVPYAPGKTDLQNANYKSPGDPQFFMDGQGNKVEMPKHFRHVLGTGHLGEDVMAGLIHGTRISLSIGLISMLIATVIGLLLGAIAGYFGDARLKTSRSSFWMGILGIVIGWFYSFHVRSFVLTDAMEKGGFPVLLQILWSICICAFCIFICARAGRLLHFIPALRKEVHVPADAAVSRLIEIFHSMPTFILIITVAAISKPSLVNSMVIIGLTSWTSIARLTRAEFLRMRNMEFIQASRALGLRESRIIWKHAMPNGIAPALVFVAFGIASAILTESGLSFLGIGVPDDTVTWGSLVHAGQQQYSAWWLVLFPGLAIFITVTAYNLIGEGLRDALDPRQKK